MERILIKNGRVFNGEYFLYADVLTDGAVIAKIGDHIHAPTDFGIFAKAIQSGVVPDIISTDITRRSAYTRGGRYGMTMCMNITKTLGLNEEDIFRAVTSILPKRSKKMGYGGISRSVGVRTWQCSITQTRVSA